MAYRVGADGKLYWSASEGEETQSGGTQGGSGNPYGTGTDDDYIPIDDGTPTITPGVTPGGSGTVEAGTIDLGTGAGTGTGTGTSAATDDSGVLTDEEIAALDMDDTELPDYVSGYSGEEGVDFPNEGAPTSSPDTTDYVDYGSVTDYDNTATTTTTVAIPTDAQGRTEYDLRRRAIQEQMTVEENRAKEALKQRLAAQGIEEGSGIYLQQMRMLEEAASQQEQQALSAVNVEELQARQKAEESAEERRFLAGESAADRAQKYWQSYNQLSLDERRLNEDARQFDNQQAFEEWAKKEGWNQDQINRVWQTQMAERKYQHDEKMAYVESELRANEARYQTELNQATDAQKAEAESYYTMGKAGEILTDSQLEALKQTNPAAYSGYFAGRAQYKLDLLDHTRGLDTIEAESQANQDAIRLKGVIEAGMLTLGESLKETREIREKEYEYYYNAGLNGEDLSIEAFQGDDGEMNSFEYANWIAYNNGKQGKTREDHLQSMERVDQYFVSRLMGLEPSYVNPITGEVTSNPIYDQGLRNLMDEFGIVLPEQQTSSSGNMYTSSTPPEWYSGEEGNYYTYTEPNAVVDPLNQRLPLYPINTFTNMLGYNVKGSYMLNDVSTTTPFGLSLPPGGYYIYERIDPTTNNKQVMVVQDSGNLTKDSILSNSVPVSTVYR